MCACAREAVQEAYHREAATRGCAGGSCDSAAAARQSEAERRTVALEEKPAAGVAGAKPAAPLGSPLEALDGEDKGPCNDPSAPSKPAPEDERGDPE